MAERKKSPRATYSEPSQVLRRKIICGQCATPYQRKLIGGVTYWISLAEIDRRLETLEQEFQSALTEAIDSSDKECSNAKFAEILAEQTALKQKKEEILKSTADAETLCSRITQAEQALQNAEPYLTEWNETTIRQLVERVTVLSKDEILVRLKGGREIKHEITK